MAADTRPLAPDPALAIEGEAAAHFALGMSAVARLTSDMVLVRPHRRTDAWAGSPARTLRVGDLHPQGLAGIQIHRHLPARSDRPVWDIAAEDVAAIGHLLALGRLPATRLVSVAGPGLREVRLVRCQPGADLRALTFAHMTPGPRAILSGSAIEGRESRWLGLRDRQVTVLPRRMPASAPHWLGAALRRASRPEPVIATAAVEQALGGLLPAMPLLRALAVGDDEAAVQLGALSLVEEDLALVDYVTDAQPRFAGLLRAALDRIEAGT
jgi:Na+-transporting NADH:ubiquinone oxidoreductase subunit A